MSKEGGNSAKYVAFGIDLGTTNSCMAGYLNNGNTVIIENKSGEKVTPSAVSFHDGECTVGLAAYSNRKKFPDTTYYQVKRLIGKNVTDKSLFEDIKNLPYEVDTKYKIPGTETIDNRPRLPFNIPGYDIKQALFPEHISAIILKYLLDCAQSKTDNKNPETVIKDVVITVPANFNDYQRRATVDAGKFAGYNVLDVLSEPTAAAICYAFKHKEITTETIMVFDFGGGTLDVSILSIDNFKFKVLATDGNTNCGGADIDAAIFKKVAPKFKAMGVDVEDKKIKGDLLCQCEKAKITLVQAIRAQIVLNYKEVVVNQATLNEICSDLKEVLKKPMKTVLETANLKPGDIDQIIAVGGSSSLPLVKDVIKDFMGKEPTEPVNPAEAIAIGAAIYGAYLKHEVDIPGIPSIEIVDVIPMALGIGYCEGNEKKVLQLVSKNEVRPFTSKVFNFKGQKNAKEVTINVFEGDSVYQRDCHLMETNTLVDPALGEDGRPELEICIDITKESYTLKAYSGEKVLENVFIKNTDAHNATEAEMIKKDIEELMRFHCDDEEEEEVEKKPAEIFSRYINSTAGKKELSGGRKIPTVKTNKVIKRYKDWATKNKNASQAEVDMKMEELKNEIKALK